MGVTKAYTNEEIEQIKIAYLSNRENPNGWLRELSVGLNRPEGNLSRYARKLGLTNRNRRQPDKICINCGKSFYTSIPNQKSCSVKCGVIVGSRKRVGRHIWVDKLHPRGMLGKHHSEKYCKEISERVRGEWANPDSKLNSEENKQKSSDRMKIMMSNQLKNNPQNIYSRTIKGWRTIGGQRHYFRSKWEMNIAYYLEWLKLQGKIRKWDYEAKTFWFEKIKRGVRSYTPDFEITEIDKSVNYIEVKGWKDKKSMTKLKRMAKYYPDTKISLIDEEQYRVMKKQIGRLCNWE